MKINYLEEDNFDKMISGKKILVDFYADWCGPCKMLGKVLESSDIDIECLKVNIDKYSDLATKYRVMSIPTVIMFDDGKEIKKNVGFMDEDELKEFVNN